MCLLEKSCLSSNMKLLSCLAGTGRWVDAVAVADWNPHGHLTQRNDHQGSSPKHGQCVCRKFTNIWYLLVLLAINWRKYGLLFLLYDEFYTIITLIVCPYYILLSLTLLLLLFTIIYYCYYHCYNDVVYIYIDMFDCSRITIVMLCMIILSKIWVLLTFVIPRARQGFMA